MMHQVVCDENGFVRGVPYHDGFLVGILVADEEVHLALRSAQGERRVLTLHGVGGLCVNGFREGNIVLNIRVLEVASALADPGIREAVVEKLYVDLVKTAAGFKLFLLESSIGADIIALCSDVTVGESGGMLGLSVP
jgi:hypothetical protein